MSALLKFAALGKQGSLSEIAEQTSIPMGESSGKTPAILDYARGMGLVEVTPKSSIKKPVLTPLGEIVYAEDKFLGEKVTQWLVHMNLCCSRVGAKAWHEVFAKGRITLGTRFTEAQLEDYLIKLFGPVKKRTRTGPLVLTYFEDEALARSSVLAKEGEFLVRTKAPLLDVYAIPYSAYILFLLEEFFPGQNQVTLTDFNNETSWFDICLWSQFDVEYILSVIERKGFISVDRQMKPWIIEKKADARDVWPLIYSEFV